jgi:hypothetical protein
MGWIVTLYAKGLKEVREVDVLGATAQLVSEEADGQLTKHFYRYTSMDVQMKHATAVFERSRLMKRKRR